MDTDTLHRIELRADAAAAAYVRLRDDMLKAVLHDPERQVDTPGFKAGSTRPAVEVVLDAFSDADGRQSLLELLSIVAGVSTGTGMMSSRLRASEWIERFAENYAAFHCDDAADAATQDECGQGLICECPQGVCLVNEPEPTRSLRPDVRNPLTSLPSAQAVRTLPDAARAALRALLLDIRRDAQARAEKCWRTHKAPMAAYWKAVAVYAGHTARIAR